MIKQISHLGIAVKDLEEARKFYRSVFGLESSEPIIGGDGTIKVSMVEIGNTLIELLQPIGSEGVMAKFLEKRGEGFHHICYEVDDITAARDRLVADGARVLGSGEPKIGAHGKPVLFLHPKDFNGTLIELEQT